MSEEAAVSIAKPDQDTAATAAERARHASQHRLLWPQLFPYRRPTAEIRPCPSQTELRLSVTTTESDGLDPEPATRPR